MAEIRNKLPRGAGGTPGGLGTFVLGLAMLLIGGYLFFYNLVVTSSFSVFWGRNASALPLLILMGESGFYFSAGVRGLAGYWSQ